MIDLSALGNVLTLTAISDPNGTFKNWDGYCSGSISTCSVDLVRFSGDITVGAVFSGNAILTSMDPRSGMQGSTVDITVRGSGIKQNSSLRVSGDGIAVSNVRVNPPSSVTATLSIFSNANPSYAYGLWTDEAGGESNRLPFTVTARAAGNCGSGSGSVGGTRLDDPGLTGYWRADGDVKNSVDGVSGTLIGGTFGPGVFGKAFCLDGIDDYVDLGNYSNVQVSNSEEFSVAAWVFFNELVPSSANRDAPPGDVSIVDKMAGIH